MYGARRRLDLAAAAPLARGPPPALAVHCQLPALPPGRSSFQATRRANLEPAPSAAAAARRPAPAPRSGGARHDAGATGLGLQAAGLSRRPHRSPPLPPPGGAMESLDAVMRRHWTALDRQIMVIVVAVS